MRKEGKIQRETREKEEGEKQVESDQERSSQVARVGERQFRALQHRSAI